MAVVRYVLRFAPHPSLNSHLYSKKTAPSNLGAIIDAHNAEVDGKSKTQPANGSNAGADEDENVEYVEARDALSSFELR